ncbi:phosphatase PAP2 family protein [Flavobacterium sp. NRK F10]|uniref:phosphatase PAP2 family protein n=1 Tax=Flavobacterium sp. NRK F10 TaxID=2954931 RepID=UPI0020918CFA|nr:phosphatase PAP2 family protein [Flavobacterium sp. NRK F10]MCO6176318.1 phosphatase PAP2 family protein [Flavobacterium sp. NRK F10]
MKVFFSIVALLSLFSVSAQIKSDTIIQDQRLKFDYKSLIIPSILVGYGIIGIESDGIKYYNSEIKHELNENIDEKFTIDDFSQYVPFVSVYALNGLGLQGKHDFKDRTIILATAYLLMGGTVYALKTTTKVERPDGSTNNSFPSGHTATAFMGAEFLYQEYKDISVWYGITGYLVAAGTGFFRMYNDRHWLTDVVAGAGIGIISTKVAYWLHPVIEKKIFKSKKKSNKIAMPFYNGKQYGVGVAITF